MYWDNLPKITIFQRKVSLLIASETARLKSILISHFGRNKNGQEKKETKVFPGTET